MASRRPRSGDDVVAVTVKTFDILVALIEDAGRVVEKHELMRIVWRSTPRLTVAQAEVGTGVTPSRR